MISVEKWMILAHCQKLPNNVGDLDKIIVATGFEWLPKVQKIAQSGHTAINCVVLKSCFPSRKCYPNFVQLGSLDQGKYTNSKFCVLLFY